MGAFIGFIIFVAIIYYIFKLFEHNEREKTNKIVDDCCNDTETISTSNKKNMAKNTSTSGEKNISENISANNESENEKPVAENASAYNKNEKPVAENNLSKFKYNNEAYISFVKNVYKAFEDFKAVGEDVKWVDGEDGFTLSRKMSKFISDETSMGYETFTAFIKRDDDNLLDLTDPYYLWITYRFTFKKSDLDYYRDFCKYMDDYNRTHNVFSRKFFMSHDVFAPQHAEIVEYWCNMFLTDNNVLDSKMKEFGEGAMLDYLFKMAKEKFIVDHELYRTR